MHSAVPGPTADVIQNSCLPSQSKNTYKQHSPILTAKDVNEHHIHAAFCLAPPLRLDKICMECQLYIQYQQMQHWLRGSLLDAHCMADACRGGLLTAHTLQCPLRWHVPQPAEAIWLACPSPWICHGCGPCQKVCLDTGCCLVHHAHPCGGGHRPQSVQPGWHVHCVCCLPLAAACHPHGLCWSRARCPYESRACGPARSAYPHVLYCAATVVLPAYGELATGCAGAAYEARERDPADQPRA